MVVLPSQINQLMPMPLSSSKAQFIDTALSCTSSYALSYAQSKQKSLIKKHLLSLLQHYPAFTPSTDKFTHNDGTTVNLLYAAGNLHISGHTPPVPLTIWLHENYPYIPPLAFISPDSISVIHENHPFVDLSGSISVPYLLTWTFTRCNLTQFVRNLVQIFRHDHPFVAVGNSPAAEFTHPSLASKMEAIDRLSGMIHYDIVAMKAEIGGEVEELTRLKGELREREVRIRCLMDELEREKSMLKERVMELRSGADLVMNWVKENWVEDLIREDDDGLEGEDEESKMVIESVAGDRAVEDLMYAMEKGLEEQVVDFGAYIKQVRVLGREQFMYRAMLAHLRGHLFHH